MHIGNPRKREHGGMKWGGGSPAPDSSGGGRGRCGRVYAGRDCVEGEAFSARRSVIEEALWLKRVYSQGMIGYNIGDAADLWRGKGAGEEEEEGAPKGKLF